MRLTRLYREWVFPHVTKWCLSGRGLETERRAALAGVRGEVLEVGFGSGLNLPFYPPSVNRLVAVDSSRAALRLAVPLIGRAAFPVDAHVHSGEELPFADKRFDAVVFTWTLCMIDDASAALAEARRVLRADGHLHFLEHGRAEEPAIVRWQDLWNPVNRLLFAGCNVNRPIAELIRDAGFDIAQLSTYYRRGPRVASYVFRGVAVKAAQLSLP